MTQTTGAKVLARMLVDYGVTHVFMVPAVLRRTLVELESISDVKRIHAHGEKAAAYMADGYARASGRPGICMAQVIGAQNLAAGLRDAWLAHSPVIAFTGGRLPATKFRHVYQEVDDVPAFEAVTKFNATIDDVSRFPDMVRQAFRVAVSGTPGPVHLQFQGNEGQIDLHEADMEPFVDLKASHVPSHRPAPAAEEVAAAVAALASAERPVIVAGGGVRASGAAAALLELAEGLSIPVATSLNGKDVIPAGHPLSVGVVGTYSRETANRIVSAADLVCFVGSQAGSMTTNFWTIPDPERQVVHVDIDPEVMGLNYHRTLPVCGDARTALQAMHAASSTRDGRRDSGWLDLVSDLKSAWIEKMRSLLESDAVPINPARICHELTQHAPADALVVVDTGHAGMWMGGLYDVRSPDQDYIRCAGHLGWAFPGSLGAKCAQPDRPVICFTGDAGFWYHIAELETAVRWRINTVTVVNNNGSGNQSKPGFDRAYGGQQTERGRELWTFSQVNFARIAEAIGAVGIRVEDPSQIGDAIRRGLEADRPVVIDVVTDVEALAPKAWVPDS